MRQVALRKDNTEAILKAIKNGFSLSHVEGDLLVYRKGDSYVEKIKATAKKILGVVQISASKRGWS